MAEGVKTTWHRKFSKDENLTMAGTIDEDAIGLLMLGALEPPMQIPFRGFHSGDLSALSARFSFDAPKPAADVRGALGRNEHNLGRWKILQIK